MKKASLIILTVAAVLLVHPQTASAASLDLTVSPVYLDLSPNPGDIIKDKVRIHNNTNSPMSINVKVDKMDINERGDVIPVEVATGDATLKWFGFTSTKVTAAAKEWTDIPYTITIPKDAAFGNYFAIAFSADTPKATGNTTVIQGDVLIPVLLNVKKAGAIAQAEIVEFTSGSFVNEYLPVDFTVKVKNTGNIHVRPRGNIFIRGAGESDLGTLEVNQGLGNILPNTTRSFTASWLDGFIIKKPVMEDGVAKIDNQGHAVTRIEINWNKLTSLRLGKYTAYVLLAYDDGQRDVPIDATITFWVFPYTAVAIAFAAIILIFVGGSYGVKSLVRREAKKLQS